MQCYGYRTCLRPAYDTVMSKRQQQIQERQAMAKAKTPFMSWTKTEYWPDGRVVHSQGIEELQDTIMLSEGWYANCSTDDIDAVLRRKFDLLPREEWLNQPRFSITDIRKRIDSLGTKDIDRLVESLSNHRSGRTTERRLSALCCLAKGHTVFIKGLSTAGTHALIRSIKAMAEQVYIPTDRLFASGYEPNWPATTTVYDDDRETEFSTIRFVGYEGK